MHFRRVVAAGRIAKMLQTDQQRSNENRCCYRPEQPAISSNEANSHKSNSVGNQKGDIANAPKALLPCCSNPALASVCCDSRSAGSSPARHDRLQVDAACTHWLCAGCRGVRVDGYLLPWPRTRNARSRTNSNAEVRSGLAAKTFGNPGVEGGAQTARPIAPHRLRIAHLLFWGGWLRELRPDVLPIIGAKISTTHRAVSGALDAHGQIRGRIAIAVRNVLQMTASRSAGTSKGIAASRVQIEKVFFEPHSLITSFDVFLVNIV